MFQSSLYYIVNIYKFWGFREAIIYKVFVWLPKLIVSCSGLYYFV